MTNENHITKKLPKNEILTKNDVVKYCTLFAEALENFERFPNDSTLNAVNRCSGLITRARELAVAQGFSIKAFDEILSDVLG